MLNQPIEVDLAVVGAGGVSGAALLFALASSTNVRSVVAFEQFSSPGMVNSHPLYNAQTSHDGGTETNYTLEKALVVQGAAFKMRRYLRSKNNALLYMKTHRMVLGVGPAEVAELEARQKEFAKDYPDLRLAYGEELRKIEPYVMKDRDPNQLVCAQVSEEGYVVNYQVLAKTLLEDAKKLNSLLDVHFNTTVIRVDKLPGGRFQVFTEQGSWIAKTLVCTAGAYSLHFAQELGYGLDFSLLPIAGNFYSAPNVLRGKVYRVQVPGLAFSKPHGDPDILSTSVTRFGPTTIPLPFMERHRIGTVPDFANMWWRASWRGVRSLIKVLIAKQILGYVGKQLLYSIPYLGTALFLKEVREIVPSMRYSDLKLRRGAGGIRPQVVDLRTGELLMGSVTIKADDASALFVTTPSPGASICMAQGEEVAQEVVAMLGDKFCFNTVQFERALDGKPSVKLHVV